MVLMLSPPVVRSPSRQETGDDDNNGWHLGRRPPPQHRHDHGQWRGRQALMPKQQRYRFQRRRHYSNRYCCCEWCGDSDRLRGSLIQASGGSNTASSFMRRSGGCTGSAPITLTGITLPADMTFFTNFIGDNAMTETLHQCQHVRHECLVNACTTGNIPK